MDSLNVILNKYKQLLTIDLKLKEHVFIGKIMINRTNHLLLGSLILFFVVIGYLFNTSLNDIGMATGSLLGFNDIELNELLNSFERVFFFASFWVFNILFAFLSFIVFNERKLFHNLNNDIIAYSIACVYKENEERQRIGLLLLEVFKDYETIKRENNIYILKSKLTNDELIIFEHLENHFNFLKKNNL